MNNDIVQQAREFIRKKEERIKSEKNPHFEQAWCDFDKIVEMIIKKYNPKRIWQWGSLLDQFFFSNISDIDIAVEGIKDWETFSAMLGDAWEMTDFPLDLVDIGDLTPIYRKYIIKDGKLVYERKNI